jgi:hypothetical protein
MQWLENAQVIADKALFLEIFEPRLYWFIKGKSAVHIIRNYLGSWS